MSDRLDIIRRKTHFPGVNTFDEFELTWDDVDWLIEQVVKLRDDLQAREETVVLQDGAIKHQGEKINIIDAQLAATKERLEKLTAERDRDKSIAANFDQEIRCALGIKGGCPVEAILRLKREAERLEAALPLLVRASVHPHIDEWLRKDIRAYFERYK